MGGIGAVVLRGESRRRAVYEACIYGEVGWNLDTPSQVWDVAFEKIFRSGVEGTMVYGRANKQASDSINLPIISTAKHTPSSQPRFRIVPAARLAEYQPHCTRRTCGFEVGERDG